jgi:general secretion pathway protein M
MSTSTPTSAWQTRWAQLAPKERTGIVIATAVVVLASVWMLIVSPGLQQWRTAEAKNRALNSQLQQMQTLQAQAQSIQAQPALAYDDAVRALRLATQQALGDTAQISIVGDRASVTLQNTQPQALAQWLTQARLNARSVPFEARLSRAPSPGPLLWNGTLTMSLPAK